MASDAEHLQMLRSAADRLESTASDLRSTASDLRSSNKELSLAVSRLTSRTKKMRPAAGPQQKALVMAGAQDRVTPSESPA